jgi:hypothetical protein
MKFDRIWNWTKAAATLVICAAAGGCLSHSTTRPIESPVEPNAQSGIDASAPLRIEVISRRLTDYDARAKKLSGDSETSYRAMMRDTFSDIANILPSLEGSDSSGAFRQQLRVIESSGGQLDSLPPELSSEPTVATGLRAAYNALAGINARQFANLPGPLKTLNDLSAKIDQLDTVHGSDFQAAVTQAVQLIGQVMREMNASLAYRLEHAPATAPATQPSATLQPSTASQPSGER